MPVTSQQDRSAFEKLVKEHFSFVEDEAQMTFAGVRSTGGPDPRDASLVARYSGSDFQLDIGWNAYELSLAVLIKFECYNLPRQDRYVYFEPFIEYLTNGVEQAVVPYVTEWMSVNQIESVMDQRQKVFEHGLPLVIEALGQRLRASFCRVKSASPDQIQGYHRWMRSKK